MTRNEIELVVSLFGPELNAQNLPGQADRWPLHYQPANDTPEGRLALSNDPRLGWRFAQRLAESGDAVTRAKLPPNGSTLPATHTRKSRPSLRWGSI